MHGPSPGFLATARKPQEDATRRSGRYALIDCDAGQRIGLISNTIWPAELHIEDLEELGLLHYLEHLTFSGEIGMWKPSRQIFLHTLDALGVAPEQAVFVGDSPREDIVGAHAAGMRAIWIRSREFPLGDVQPDAIIESLPELLPILEHWRA